MTELSREARALMEQGLSDGPTAHDRQRIKARLAAELGVGAFAAATVATAAGAHVGGAEAVKSTSLWLKGVASFVALTGGAAAIYVGLASPSASERPLASPRAQMPLAAAPIAETQPSSAQPAPSMAPAGPPLASRDVGELTPAQRKPRRARGEAVARSTVESATASQPERDSRAVPEAAGDVQAELALLARAQRALRDGDPEGALAAAREHASRFADGALSEERGAIVALANCRLGRGSAEARAFLARSPASPLAARVRKECGSE
jgi:hypothetical protein